MSTPTETAPLCEGVLLGSPPWARRHCNGCAALATLQAENAELRERLAVFAQNDADHFAGLRAEAATLRERLEAAEAVTTSLGAQLAEMEVGLAAAEGERDRLRGLLERAVAELRGVETFSLERFIPANSVHRVIVDASAALAAIPHTKGEASAPPTCETCDKPADEGYRFCSPECAADHRKRDAAGEFDI